MKWGRVCLVLGLVVLLVGLLITPASAAPAGPSVRFWVFYDKLADGWPNPWTGVEGPAITSYNWDSAWVWEYGAPSYQLYALDSLTVKTGEEVRARGRLVSEGYLPPSMELSLPAGDGNFAVILLPPRAVSPNGTPWRVSSEPFQLAYSYAGKVNVKQPMSGRWTGNQVLVGIINHVPDICGTRLWLVSQNYWNWFNGSGYTPGGIYHPWVTLPDGFVYSVGPYWTVPLTGRISFGFSTKKAGAYIMYARDESSGCAASAPFTVNGDHRIPVS